jgi:hypothetical protein
MDPVSKLEGFETAAIERSENPGTVFSAVC